MITTYRDPNQFIAARRKELGLSPAELCAQIGGTPAPSESLLALIEDGRSNVPLAKCNHIAAALQVDPVWFTMCIITKQHPEVAGVLSRAVRGTVNGS